MSAPIDIRDASPDDAEALRAIYQPYVDSTAISFELETPTIEELAQRIETVSARWGWLVASHDDRIVGYAYGSSHRPRAAYRYSVETSAYVLPERQRRGIAGALYRVLLRRLARQGYRNAYAGVTLPNEASMAFHQRMGFEPIGVFPRVGYKLGAWHDVAWLHRALEETHDA